MLTVDEPPADASGRRERLKVAFVVQRCGSEIAAGAERACLQVAQHMTQYWDTEILTTCARDYMEWQNYYSPGLERIGETSVRRFPVDAPRDVPAFNRLSEELRKRQGTSSLEEQEAWMRAQGPVSTQLLDYLRTHHEEYDLFVFFGYLYATTYFGLPLVAGKAYLAPLAHDEWPIYFSMFDAMFSLPRAFIFNTQSERDFLHQRFPDVAIDGEIVAIGVEKPRKVDPERFRRQYGLHDPFLLYIGRIDESKGCRDLLRNFAQAKAAGLIEHKLVLIGERVMPVDFRNDVITLGVLPEEEKWNALAACDWLVMPSPFESLSLVLLEAWLMERPVLVNGHCDVLQQQCQQSNGGLWYSDPSEWTAALSSVSEAEKQRLGRNGRRFVEQFYSWSRVERGYLDLVNRFPCDANASVPS